MRRTFAKLAALLLMLSVALTGCNLIEVNQVEIINQQRAELEELYSAVLAEYDGGTVTVFDAIGPFYDNYSYMAQMYSMFGMEMTEDDFIGMQEEAVESEVINVAIAREFENRGLTLEKSEEEIQAEVDESYNSTLDYYLDMVEGETEEEKVAAAELELYREGYTRERLYDMYVADYRATALEAAVMDEVAEVTEEELKAAYDERVAADEETYTANPTYYEEDAMDETITVCWVPEGYRAVKHVLVIPEETVLQVVTDARNALETAQSELADLEAELAGAADDEEARAADEIQADIDAKTAEIPALETAVADAEAACLESVKDKTDLIYADLTAGKSIDEVMAAYGEDPGMQSEPNMTTGYYVREDSTTWDANFTAGSMALAQVGDYSIEPVISTSGVHIIYYASDVTSGAVDLETVRESLTAQTLETKKAEHYTSCMNEWYQALNATYSMENWVFG